MVDCTSSSGCDSHGNNPVNLEIQRDQESQSEWDYHATPWDWAKIGCAVLLSFTIIVMIDWIQERWKK